MDAQAPGAGTGQLTPYCPVFHAAIELIGRRWSGAIVRSMLAGSVRFSDILAAIPGLSDRLLSQRLRELEGAGVVTRIVHADTPVRIEYQLTDKGHELQRIVEDLGEWAERWSPAAAGAHRR